MKKLDWDRLPSDMKSEEVKAYFEILSKKKGSLFFKRMFDIVVSFLLLILLSPLFLILALAIKLDSEGPVFYRQERITQFGESFRIFKFRSMVFHADENGSLVTVSKDGRITKVGAVIRKYRLDEIAQLIDVFRGTMSFVGTRPEVKKYVKAYTPEMKATLLLPAGVTSLASIMYQRESELLKDRKNADAVYINSILPKKMEYNLSALRNFSFFSDIKIMIMTVFAVLGVNLTGREDKGETDTPERKNGN